MLNKVVNIKINRPMWYLFLLNNNIASMKSNILTPVGIERGEVIASIDKG